MGRALSMDLRERVMAAVDGGMSCRAAAARFGVGVSSAIRWRQLQLNQGHLKPGRPGGDVRSAALEAHRDYLHAASNLATWSVTIAHLSDSSFGTLRPAFRSPEAVNRYHIVSRCTRRMESPCN